MDTLQAEINRLTAEIERYKNLEKTSHETWVKLKSNRGKLITQAEKVSKLLEGSKMSVSESEIPGQ